MLYLIVALCLRSVICVATSSPGVAPEVKLNDGHLMPTFGLGTWLGVTPEGQLAEVQDDSIEKAVEDAIDVGYRHIDTAALYNTEPQVGRGIHKKIADGALTREEIFVTTKLWNDQHAREKVVPALKNSLQQLNMSYVDLYLIHFPIGTVSNFTPDLTDYLETWYGMIDAQTQGLTRSIGVSNFNQDMIQRLVRETGVVPAVLQVEIHLNLQQPALLEFCRQRGIAVMGYTPFGPLFPSKASPGAPPPRIDDPALVEMARKYKKTVPQVVLRYLYELGVVPIPKSVKRSRIQQNIEIFDFAIEEADKRLLRSFDANYRLTSMPFWKDHPYYPFHS
ncbi:unnamed protein product [Pieris brassicae]|uniref:NADP-dependent oxidoreductase domain-containing protein n=1 Tax=Pieris brassicae TaxID=7116 RepID=A0A9P0TND1_PIEBR|nr:unnamed protein product [Pieris brassicae]